MWTYDRLGFRGWLVFALTDFGNQSNAHGNAKLERKTCSGCGQSRLAWKRNQPTRKAGRDNGTQHRKGKLKWNYYLAHSLEFFSNTTSAKLKFTNAKLKSNKRLANKSQSLRSKGNK